jgi:Ca-activated chloride channel family protein
MHYDTPVDLTALFILIPFAVFEVIHYHRRSKTLKLLKLLKKEHLTRYILSSVCFALFIAGAIIALAGPRWGTRSVMEYKRGVDAVFAFDVSRSMEAADVAPSRLYRAVAVAKEAAHHAGGLRMGAAAGKGMGVLALPLTWDKNAIITFLDSLLIENQTGRGTNLENLIDAANRAFLDSFPAKRLIVLFSDGESLSGSLQAAVDRARAGGASIAAVGIGTEEGGAVPQRFILDEDTGEPVPDQAPVTSRLNREALQDAAARSGGVYIDGGASDAAAVLAQYITSLAPETGVSSYKIEAAPRWRVFVIAALIFLLLSKCAEKKIRGNGRSEPEAEDA